MINLDNLSFSVIQCHKTAFVISRANRRPVHCSHCGKEIAPGLGLYRHTYRANGYVCFSCFVSIVKVAAFVLSGDGDLGFRVSIFGTLQLCAFGPKAWTSTQVIEAARAAMLERAYTAADGLIGNETADTQKIADTADAMLG